MRTLSRLGLVCVVFIAWGCRSAPQTSTTTPPEKFRLTSEDGRNQLTLGGLVQVLARASDDARDPQTDFTLKRARPEISGRLAGSLLFNLEPNFSEDDVELEEAWIGPRFGDERNGATLHLGRMKAPFGLEEVRSRRYIDFPFFSIVNQLEPAEDHGVFLNGMAGNGRLEYGLAVYNGPGGADTNGSKDVALRFMAHPFVEETGSTMENLQVGIAGTFGVQDEGLDGTAIENEIQLPVAPYAADARLDGSRERLGLELAWFQGSWFAQSEYIGVRQEMSGSGGAEEASFHGGYVTLAHVLTGEAKSFGPLLPNEPYDFATGSGRGAWVLAARYSMLALDEALEASLIVPGRFTDRIQTGSLALNWIPNAYAIVRMALVGSYYADEILLDDGPTDHEAAFLVEFQLHF